MSDQESHPDRVRLTEDLEEARAHAEALARDLDVEFAIIEIPVVAGRVEYVRIHRTLRLKD